MADVSRVHGSPATGGFYGLQGALVIVNYSNKFTADSVDGTTKVITEGGYAKAVKALQQVASIVWLGDHDSGDDYFSAIVDSATFNTGGGATTSGAYGALADALTSQLGGTASSYQSGTSVYTTLKGDGTWAA
jgi:hypothetical protein